MSLGLPPTRPWRNFFDRWAWLIVPGGMALVSRALSIALVLHAAQAGSPLVGASPLVNWDGQWYLRIVRDGYHAEAITTGHHDFAFFPGWPLVIRIVSLNGILPFDITAVVLANVLFIAAAVAAYGLFVRRFGARPAVLGTLLLCFNPVSYVYSLAYSEPLFTLVVALYFLDRRGRSTPLYAAVATLVRVSGLAIAASAAVMLVLRRGHRRTLLLSGAAVALAFAAWWVFIWHLTGSFTGWLQGTPGWDRDQGIASITFMWRHHRSWALEWMGLVALMIVGSLLMVRRHPDLAVYGLVAIAFTFVSGAVWSMPRHSLAAFPAFGALADRLGTRLSSLLLVAFLVGEYVFTGLAFGANANPP
jgi:hypothetical protein